MHRLGNSEDDTSLLEMKDFDHFYLISAQYSGVPFSLLGDDLNFITASCYRMS